MKLENLKTIEEMSLFINGTQSITFEVLSSKDEVYKMIEQILRRFCYRKLKKKDKGIVIHFLIKISGYSRQQLTRMINRDSNTGRLTYHHKTINGFK